MPTTVYRCDLCGKVYQGSQDARKCEIECNILAGRFNDLLRVYTLKHGAEKAEKLSEEARKAQLERNGHPSLPDDETIKFIESKFEEGAGSVSKRSKR